MPISDLLPLIRYRDRNAPLRRADQDMFDLRDEMNVIFNDFFAQPYGPGAMRRLQNAWGDFNPGLDVSETEREVIVEADLPGLDQKDIELSLEGRVLTLSGTRKREFEHKDAQVHQVERSYGTFQRSISLPFEADIRKVEATFSRGVLKIVLPKPSRPEESKRRIPIKTGG